MYLDSQTARARMRPLAQSECLREKQKKIIKVCIYINIIKFKEKKLIQKKKMI